MVKVTIYCNLYSTLIPAFIKKAPPSFRERLLKIFFNFLACPFSLADNQIMPYQLLNSLKSRKFFT